MRGDGTPLFPTDVKPDTSHSPCHSGTRKGGTQPHEIPCNPDTDHRRSRPRRLPPRCAGVFDDDLAQLAHVLAEVSRLGDRRPRFQKSQVGSGSPGFFLKTGRGDPRNTRKARKRNGEARQPISNLRFPFSCLSCFSWIREAPSPEKEKPPRRNAKWLRCSSGPKSRRRLDARANVGREWKATGASTRNSTRRWSASRKSRNAPDGSMIVSRRPPTSSVIFRKRPR